MNRARIGLGALGVLTLLVAAVSLVVLVTTAACVQRVIRAPGDEDADEVRT
jgi:archaellin